MAAAPTGWGRQLEWVAADSFGERGVARRELRRPVDVASLDDGTLVVVDEDRDALVLFSERGRYLRTLAGERGVGAVVLRRPIAVAVDDTDRIWVVDRGNHRLVVMDAAGGLLQVVGSLGSRAGRFRSPAGLAFDGRGKAFVADTGNRRIQVLRSRDGEPVAEWRGNTGGRRGHLDSPVAVAYSGQGKGGLWVVNRGSQTLESFDLEGEWQRSLTLPQTVDGEVDLVALAVEPALERMFLSDAAGGRVLVLNRRGELMGSVRPAEPFAPRGLVVTRQLDLYVVDSARSRIVQFLRQ